jgi:hypothetical protein
VGKGGGAVGNWSNASIGSETAPIYTAKGGLVNKAVEQWQWESTTVVGRRGSSPEDT